MGPGRDAFIFGKRWARDAKNSGRQPNSIFTGTGPLALAGVLRVGSMSTVTEGYAEWSTCPANFFVMIGTSSFAYFVVQRTSQFSLGAFMGTRP